MIKVKSKRSSLFVVNESIFNQAIVVEKINDIEEQDDCDWVTLDGGAHVCIGGDGIVKKGPEFAKGKSVGDLGGSSGGSHSRIVKKIRQAKQGVPKKDLKNINWHISDKEGFYISGYGTTTASYFGGTITTYKGLSEVPDKNVDGVIKHEIGHNAYTNLDSFKKQQYTTIYQTEKSPTKYAELTPEEDFAESYRLYYTGENEKLGVKRRKFFDDLIAHYKDGEEPE